MLIVDWLIWRLSLERKILDSKKKTLRPLALPCHGLKQIE